MCMIHRHQVGCNVWDRPRLSGIFLSMVLHPSRLKSRALLLNRIVPQLLQYQVYTGRQRRSNTRRKGASRV